MRLFSQFVSQNNRLHVLQWYFWLWWLHIEKLLFFNKANLTLFKACFLPLFYCLSFWSKLEISTFCDWQQGMQHIVTKGKPGNPFRAPQSGHVAFDKKNHYVVLKAINFSKKYLKYSIQRIRIQIILKTMIKWLVIWLIEFWK